MADDEGVATMATLANATTLAMGNGCHDDDVGDAGVGGMLRLMGITDNEEHEDVENGSSEKLE